MNLFKQKLSPEREASPDYQPSSVEQEKIFPESLGAEKEPTSSASPKPITSPPPAPSMAPPEQGNYQIVEKILEEDLAETYFNLSPEEKVKFKVKGEETTHLIMAAVNQPKIKVKKIIHLIGDWLNLIPRINKFFLEQMAKIKTDKILSVFGKNKKIR